VLSEVLAITARMRCAEQCRLLKAGQDGDLYASRERCSGGGRQPQVSHRHRSLSRLCSPCSRPSPISGEYPILFREPLQFIVIAVMSVMRGAFPDTNGVFYVTINSWRVRGPSRHRHGERHRRNALPKRLLAGVTVMTLMTVNRRRILDARFVCHPRGLSSITY
jgi:hypothetical protein